MFLPNALPSGYLQNITLSMLILEALDTQDPHLDCPGFDNL